VQNENGGDTVIIEEKVTKTNGEIVIKKYSRGKALGRGGFAKCYEITSL
jgi:polo-like kinase 1